MSKLTKSQRKAINQKLSNHLHHTESSNLTLQQNNIHMDASEIDALHRMQNSHPELVNRILDLKEKELSLQENIIGIEEQEQTLRVKEAPYIRIFAFLGQFMAYSISLFTLVGGAYFGYHDKPVIAGFFLTSTVGVAAARFFSSRNKNTSKSEEE